MEKARHHYEKITTNENFRKFFVLEQELHTELDKTDKSDNWIILEDNTNKCKLCDSIIICNDDEVLKYKKLIHQYITCFHNK